MRITTTENTASFMRITLTTSNKHASVMNATKNYTERKADSVQNIANMRMMDTWKDASLSTELKNLPVLTV